MTHNDYVISDFKAFSDEVLQRFGLGSRLTLVITDAPIDGILAQANALDDLADASLPAGTTMFYLDNACHMSGMKCMVVQRQPAKRILSPCKTLDTTTLYNMLVQAIQAYRGRDCGGMAYLLRVNEGKWLASRQPYYVVDASASVDALVASGSYPAKSDTRRPDWAPVASAAAAAAVVSASKRSSSSVSLKTGLIMGGVLLGIVVLATIAVLFYELRRRQ